MRVRLWFAAPTLAICLFSSGYLCAQTNANAKQDAFKQELGKAQYDLMVRGLMEQAAASPEDYASQIKGKPDPGPAYAIAITKAADDPALTQILIGDNATLYADSQEQTRTLVQMALLQAAQNAKIIQLLKQTGRR